MAIFLSILLLPCLSHFSLLLLLCLAFSLYINFFVSSVHSLSLSLSFPSCGMSGITVEERCGRKKRKKKESGEQGSVTP